MVRKVVQQRSVIGAGVVPDVNTMSVREIVLNETDGKSWTKDTAGALVELTGSPATPPQPAPDEGEVFKVRGHSGDYIVDPADDFTLIVFVTGSTVTIPDGVVFPPGYRIWLRQNHGDAGEYVYVTGAAAISITSYQGYTGTAGQYATIEIINVGGSNWLLKGEGAVKSAPAAPSTYIPNKGVKVGAGQYLTGLNLTGQIAESRKMSFRAFVKMAPIAVPPPGPDPTGNFTVNQSFLFPGRPGNSVFNSTWGIDRTRTVYFNNIPSWIANCGDDNYPHACLQANSPLIASDGVTIANQSTEAYIAYDIEYPVWDGNNSTQLAWYTAATEDCQDQLDVKGLGQRMGFYAEIPLTNTYIKYQVPGSAAYIAAQASADLRQSLANVCGAFFPSLYTITWDDIQGWKNQATGQMDEAARLRDASPSKDQHIMPFMWMQLNHATVGDPGPQPRAFEYLPGPYWREQLEHVYAHPETSGLVMWGPAPQIPAGFDSSYRTWDVASTYGWWTETVDFMQTTLATP